MPPPNDPSEASYPWILSAERWRRPLLLTPALRRTLARWVEAAYPYQACGLLVGRFGEQDLEVVRVALAANLVV